MSWLGLIRAVRPAAVIALLVVMFLLFGCAADALAALAGDGPVARLLFGDGLYDVAILGGILKGVVSVGKTVGGAVVGGVKEAGKFVGRQVKRLPTIAAGIGAGGPLGGALAIITGEVGGVAAGKEPDQRVLAETVGTPPFAATERGSFGNVLTAWAENVRRVASGKLRDLAGEVETDAQRMARERAAVQVRGSGLTTGLLIGGGVAALIGLGALVFRGRR